MNQNVNCVAGWNAKMKNKKFIPDFNWIEIVLQDAEEGAVMDEEMTNEMKTALQMVRLFIDAEKADA